MPRIVETIIAYAGEDRRFLPVSDFAAVTAKASGDRVILYDVDAVGLHIPFPMAWAAKRDQAMFNSGRLTADMLEAVGRVDLANQVRVLRGNGVEAYGWLPEGSGMEAIAEYARIQNAHLIVVPSHSNRRNATDLLHGKDLRDLSEQTGIRVAIVGETQTAALEAVSHDDAPPKRSRAKAALR